MVTYMGEKRLFPHQIEAINSLNNTFSNPYKKYSGILVIPTGGGKTFTTVTWLRAMRKHYGCKVIWLAHSFELLNQVARTLSEIDSEVNYRIISSNADHSKTNSIVNEDDILIITSQTAIGTIKDENSNFYRFLSVNSEIPVIVVLDEAHHAPAKGCRNMLNRMAEILNYMWLLGLTATPTYTDRTKRGWLWKVFNDGIVYKVEKELLQKERILARENIIRRKTPHRVEISDKEFNKIVRYSTDIPENIIEELSSNQERNDFIINEYLKNKNYYGKTIIFLDRWYQCIYFKEKLVENGINADAIYYQNERGSDNNNKAIIDAFRKDKIQVLLNIKMMTEGADVPDIKTVFITRETTSHILLQQMIGRALRGERAGGKKEIANIVLFGDSWSKSIAWAIPELNGGIEESRVYQKGTPIDKISLGLVEKLVKTMTFQTMELHQYLSLIPIGWYKVEYIIFGQDESIAVIKDYILVYENEKERWENLFEAIKIDDNDFWAEENIDLDLSKQEEVNVYVEKFVKGTIEGNAINVIKICRHIMQNGERPDFFSFVDRDKIDLEQIARKIISINAIEQFSYLKKEYSSPGNVWSILYGNFYYFKSAVDMCINRILFSEDSFSQMNSMDIIANTTNNETVNEAQEKEIIHAVKLRDNNACACCGLTSKETKLVVANIIQLGTGIKNINNLQTLCTKCNLLNVEKRINFKSNKSLLLKPNKFNGVYFDIKYTKNISRIRAAIKASVNILYECNACYDVKISRRSNSIKYNTCEILVYNDNNINWLSSQMDSILKYVNNNLGQDHIKKITIIKVN